MKRSFEGLSPVSFFLPVSLLHRKVEIKITGLNPSMYFHYMWIHNSLNFFLFTSYCVWGRTKITERRHTVLNPQEFPNLLRDIELRNSNNLPQWVYYLVDLRIYLFCFKNGQRTWMDISVKRRRKWPISKWKDAWHH
jgi:hypothetical protein